MSINKKELIKIVERIAPPELMESWDNTGVQLLVENDNIDRILCCLDVCKETVEEAINYGCNFIISHHPVIFDSLKSISCEDAKGSLIIKLIENGISVYSAHTSFDTVHGGNNDFLANRLELKNVYAPEEEPIMRIGDLIVEKTLREFCKNISARLLYGEGLFYCGDLQSMCFKVGICTGAGASVMDIAAKCGCDVLVTGDMRYHDFQKAEELGIAVIDAGHFETEIFFGRNMGKQLKKELEGKAEVIVSEAQSNFKKYFSNKWG